MPDEANAPSSALAALVRWEFSGGTWAILRHSPAGELTISLRTCTAGEEVEQLTTGDPEVLTYVDDRARSDD
ncbi:hypothetical protein [Pseudactinotalea suaedae]|uniref:hypothetical protein n=1 Tax=Pseudactinotalea suaedae TaxID=1524924 RepID=UPI0012E2793F|nr:hypothetical protein [Pseudactinotalea suaedae]